MIAEDEQTAAAVVVEEGEEKKKQLASSTTTTPTTEEEDEESLGSRAGVVQTTTTDTPPGAVDSPGSSRAGSAAANNNHHSHHHHHHQQQQQTGSWSGGGVSSSPMRSLSSSSGGLFVSAPGKIILFGEHAVVYGKTAVAGSIDLRTYVSLFTSADGVIYLSLPDLNIEKTWPLKDLLRGGERLAQETSAATGVEFDAAGVSDTDDLAPPSLELAVPLARKLSGSCEEQCGAHHAAILAFWYLLLGIAQRKRELLAPKVTVRFKLPSCVGLGSSGAYCVCIASALLQSAGLIGAPGLVVDESGSATWDDRELDLIRRWAAAAESLIHGRASGLDATVCTYGGVASYKPGTRISHLKNLPDLRVILVNSKVERNTSRMVQTVKQHRKDLPEVVDSIFAAIDAISRRAAEVLTLPEENGEDGGQPLHNGDSSARTTVDDDHNCLHPSSRRTGSVRSQSLASYVAGGKRTSCASAASGASALTQTAAPPDTFSKLNELCRMNNQLLVTLGVGHPKVEQICTLLARYGIHPKMTGAGGGGSIFAFLKPDTSPTLLDMMTQDLQRHDYEVWQPTLGGPGVLVHARRPDLFTASGSSAGGTSSTVSSVSPSSVASTPAPRRA